MSNIVLSIIVKYIILYYIAFFEKSVEFYIIERLLKKAEFLVPGNKFKLPTINKYPVRFYERQAF